MISCFVLALDLGYPQGCGGVTLDGLKAFPESWRIPVTQGFVAQVAAYLLKDQQSAATYYTLAASRQGAPKFLQRIAKHLVDSAGTQREGTRRDARTKCLVHPAAAKVLPIS